jgi:hypothetical protein
MLSGIGVISWVADTYNPAGHTPSRPLRGSHVSYRRLINIHHSICGKGRKWPGTDRHDFRILANLTADGQRTRAIRRRSIRSALPFAS